MIVKFIVQIQQSNGWYNRVLTIQNLATECVECWFWQRSYARVWALWRRCRRALVRSGYPVLLCSEPGSLANYRLDGCDPAGRLGHRVTPVPFYDPVTSAWNCNKHHLASEHADWPFSYVWWKPISVRISVLSFRALLNARSSTTWRRTYSCSSRSTVKINHRISFL